MNNLFSEEMSFFILLFQLFALFPFSLNEIVQVLLKLFSALNVTLLVGIFTSAYFINPILGGSESLSGLVGGLVFNGLLITHLINIIQAYSTRQEQAEIYRKFDEIDFTLNNKLLVNVNYRKLRQSLILKNSAIMLVVSIIQAVSVSFALKSGNMESYQLHLILSNFIIRLRCIQNMFYVDLMNEKLCLINKKLADIVTKNRDKLAFILYPEKVTKSQSDFNGIKNSSLYEQLMALKQIYGKIWDVTNLINDCFGWSLLVIVTEYFIEFTSNGYWLFLALIQSLDMSFTIFSLCSLFPIVIVLTAFAYSCYQCSQNAQQTGVLIHKIERDINNDLQNALIREFSLQIIHEPVEISANGFFNINFSLLGSMSAATVTYLVILIQFQLSEIKKSSNSTAT